MMKIFKPYVSWRARWYALKVLMGTQLAEGPMVKRFEEEFAKQFLWDPRMCIALNSGSSALELAYQLADIGPGDEVIVPVLTCTATVIPLVRRGATIIYADVRKDTLTIDPSDVYKRVTDRTKAIVYVDFGGSTATLGEIMAICGGNSGIRLIRDAAQSVGDNFRPDGDFVCVSFQAIKTLTSGDGGMLIVNPKLTGCFPLADKARRLRWFGYDREKKQRDGDADLTEAGYKYHMNDIAAAIALGNLRSLPWALKRRERVADVYRSAEIPGGTIIVSSWMATLVHPHAFLLADDLEANGVEAKQHHFRCDKYTVLGPRREDVPNMDWLENKYVHLPYHHDISPKDAHRIVDLLQFFASTYD